MTITKEELHKLIKNLDCDILNDNNYILHCPCCHTCSCSGIPINEALEQILEVCTKEKELTLKEKLINKGFIKENDTVFTKKLINVLFYNFYNEFEFIIVRVYNDKCLEQLNIHDVNNHDKVFEAIDFLTKWQS